MIRATLTRIGVGAIAATTLLATAAPAVSAAPATPPTFEGAAESLALELRIHDPAGLLSSVTGNAPSLVERVSFTTGTLASSDGPVASATLLDGDLAALLGGEFPTRLSSESGATEGREQLAAWSDPSGLVSYEGGSMAFIADPARHLSWSSSELSRLQVSVAGLVASAPAEAAPITDAVNEAVEQAVAVVNDLVSELNAQIQTIEDTVNEQLPEDVQLPPVLADAAPVVPNVTEVPLLLVEKMWSETTVEAVDGIIRSTAKAGLAEASLLGGLIRIPAFQFVSTAETGGTPGSAKADTEVVTVGIELGEQEVTLSGDTLTVGDVTLDLSAPELGGVDISGPLAEIEALLLDLLNAGGLDVTQGEGTIEIAEDGSSATARTSAFGLSVAPLHAASAVPGLPEEVAAATGTRIEMLALPTTATAAAGTEIARAGDPAPAPNLPRTGGGTALLGLLTLAGAALLKRR